LALHDALPIYVAHAPGGRARRLRARHGDRAHGARLPRRVVLARGPALAGPRAVRRALPAPERGGRARRGPEQGARRARLEADGRRARARADHGRRRRGGPRARRVAVDRPRRPRHVGGRVTTPDERDLVRHDPAPLDRDAVFYVAGHRGLVGSAVWRRLERAGFSRLVGRTSAELDLTNRDATFAFFREHRPRYVVLAAAKVGGIMVNAAYPVDFLSENVRIQVNVLDAARANRKSTRLNSSHVKTSYAVFCLKKKKIKLRTITIDLK